MRAVKRIVCLALALMLVLGLTVTASAASAVTYTELLTPEELDEFYGGYATHLGEFNDGVAWLGFDFYGAIDTDGNAVVAPLTYYRGTMDFSDGVAWAYKYKERAYAAVDSSGRELFTLDPKTYVIYDNGSFAFHDGLSKVDELSTGKYGYVDETGTLVIPCVHNDRCGNFYEGLAVCYDKDYGYYGYMDKTGKMVIPAKYTSAGAFKNGVALVNDGKRWMVIDKTGKDIIPADCSVSKNPIITPQVVQVSYNGHCAFVNRAGQIVSSGFANAETYNYADGMIKVSKYDDASGYQRVGFVNEAGQLVIPCQYASVSNFMDGYAYVTQSESGQPTRYTFIDKAGNALGTYTAEKGVVLGPAGNGCFMVQGNRRYGFIDYTGKEIAPCKYLEIGATYTTDATMHRNFSGGVIPVKNGDEQWGFLDVYGNMVIECSLGDVKMTNEPGIYEVKDLHGKGTGWSVIKFSGWTEPTVSSKPATPAAPKDAPSDYAKKDIDTAVAAGIVPSDMLHDYQKAITRADFCRLAVALYEKCLGKAIQIDPSKTFTDTTDTDILKMASLNVVGGRGKGIFDPKGSLTREEAAKILAELAKTMGKPMTEKTYPFKDTISDWAQGYVRQVFGAGIMNGVETTKFSAKGTYTLEQSIVTMVRMMNYYNG